MLELAFKAANGVALVGWLALAFAPWRRAALIRAARIVALLLAVTYTLIFIGAADGAKDLIGNYSLDGIGAFFADPALRLVGWVHYLAFDLWVGTWEAEEAGRIGMPHAGLLPCLFLTFMVGPVGLLMFAIARTVVSRRGSRVSIRSAS